ncbi:unnamed protein product, partial [Prorocentrum cordatum]
LFGLKLNSMAMNGREALELASWWGAAGDEALCREHFHSNEPPMCSRAEIVPSLIDIRCVHGGDATNCWRALALSADGRVASSDGGGQIVIHDSENEPLYRLEPTRQGACVCALAFAVGGVMDNCLVSGGDDGSVVVYDVHGEELCRRVEVHGVDENSSAWPVLAIVFLGDGRIASASYLHESEEVALFKIIGSELHLLKRITAGSRQRKALDVLFNVLPDLPQLALADDGRLAYCGDKTQSGLRFFNIAGEEYKHHADVRSKALAFEPNGCLVSVCRETVTIYGVTGVQLRCMKQRGHNHDGPAFLHPLVHELQDMKECMKVAFLDELAEQYKFSPDGSLAVGMRNGLLFIYGARRLSLFNPSQSARSKASWSGEEDPLNLFETSTPLLYWKPDLGGRMSVVFTSDGRLAFVNWDGSLALCDIVSTKWHSIKLPNDEKVRAVAFAPDGSLFAKGSDLESTISNYRYNSDDTEQPCNRFTPVSDPPRDPNKNTSVELLAVMSDGRHMVSCGSDGYLAIFTLDGTLAKQVSLAPRGETQSRLPGLLDPDDEDPLLLMHVDPLLWTLQSVALAPDDRFAVGGVDGSLALYAKVGDQEELWCTKPHGDRQVTALAFPANPGDHHQLASGATDGSIVICSTDDGHVGGSYNNHGGKTITTLAFASNGCLASGGLDDSIVLWSREIRGYHIQQVAVYPLTSAAVCIAFSPKEPLLAAGSADGCLAVFPTMEYPLPQLWRSITDLVENTAGDKQRERDLFLGQHPFLLSQAIPVLEYTLLHWFVRENKVDAFKFLSGLCIEKKIWGGLEETVDGNLLDLAVKTESLCMIQAVLEYLQQTPVRLTAMQHWTDSLGRLVKRFTTNVFNSGFVEFLDSRLTQPGLFTSANGAEQLPTQSDGFQSLRVVGSFQPALSRASYMESIAPEGLTLIALRALWLPKFQPVWEELTRLSSPPESFIDSTINMACVEHVWQTYGKMANIRSAVFFAVDAILFVILAFLTAESAAAHDDAAIPELSAPWNGIARWFGGASLGLQASMPLFSLCSTGIGQSCCGCQVANGIMKSCRNRCMRCWRPSFFQWLGWRRAADKKEIPFALLRVSGATGVLFGWWQPLWLVPINGLRATQWEVRALGRQGWVRYKLDRWNAVDWAFIVMCTVVPAAVLLAIIDSQDSIPFMAVTMLLLSIRLVSFLRAYRSYGHLVQMI